MQIHKTLMKIKIGVKMKKILQYQFFMTGYLETYFEVRLIDFIYEH